MFDYHTDAIGSVRMITDDTGQVVARYDYLPFGEPCDSLCGNQPPPDQRRQFAGKERDQETRFDYFGARYHSSGTGRFTTVDPVLDVEAGLADPQQWNRYAYARNNPFAFVDPAGASIELLGDDEEARNRELELLRKAVGSSAGQRLYINTIGEGKDARYFVGIRGDVGDFMRLGDAAHNLGNLIVHQNVVEFGLTSEDLTFGGGSQTFPAGAHNNSNPRVLVNPAQLAIANGRLNPATSPYGFLRFEGQRETPPWIWNPYTTEMLAWHEFGHAWGLINGRPLRRTDQESLDWDNQMRAIVYGPLGPRNARRRAH